MKELQFLENFYATKLCIFEVLSKVDRRQRKGRLNI